MAVVRTQDGRIILKRSKESGFFHALGVIGLAILTLFPVWFLIDAWSERSIFTAVVALVILGLILPFVTVLLEQYFLRIVLSPNHMAIHTWHGTPRVYVYDDIVDIETVVVKEDAYSWRGSHLRLAFNDGRSLKIGSGLVSARTFRSLLREKSGRTFRKKRR